MFFLKAIKIHCKEYIWFSNCFVSFFCYHFSKPIYHNIIKLTWVNKTLDPKEKKLFLIVGFVIYMSSLKKDPLGYSLSKKTKEKKDGREEGKGDGKEGRKGEREGEREENVIIPWDNLHVIMSTLQSTRKARHDLKTPIIFLSVGKFTQRFNLENISVTKMLLK